MDTAGLGLPDRVRAWLEQVAPPVRGLHPVGGGITDTKWVVRLSDGDRLILRWSDPRVWGETGRDHVRREILACELLAGSGLPVPEVVASDLDGTIAGGPAGLLTWLPGQVRLDPLGPPAVSELARLAVSVHDQPVPAERRPPTFVLRGPTAPEVPTWAWWPGLWRRAIAIRAGGAPATPYGLLHRDFHFGNTLWERDRISGLIDWAEASWGPADLDVAHLCSDFAMLHGTAEAEAFRAAYGAAGGQLDADPDAARYWQVGDIIGFLPDPAHILAGMGGRRPDLTADAVRRGLEDLLARTLA